MTSPLDYLLAEKQAVQGFLDRIPEEAVLERNSWLARLEALDEAIEEERSTHRRARVVITYSGSPVVGSYGIDSEFALTATQNYVNLVEQLVADASGFNSNELHRERLSSVESELVIVGATLGSFELEERGDARPLGDGKTAVADALAKAQMLLAFTLRSDDELAQATLDVDRSVIDALEEFLSVLARARCICGIETNESHFQFDSLRDVERSLERLEYGNIHRKEKHIVGRIRYFYRDSREFEFVREDNGKAITVKIDSDLRDFFAPDKYTRRTVRLTVLAYHVGKSRAHYLLLQRPEWL